MIDKSLIISESIAVPSKYVICCSLLANRLLSMKINGAPIEITLKGERAICSLYGEDSHLTAYDMAVLDAVDTLWEFGRSDHILSTASIYRIMVHNDDFYAPSDNNFNETKESLNRLSTTYVRIVSKNTNDVIADEPLIYLVKTDSDARALECEPVILRMSKDLGHFSVIPAALLAVRNQSGDLVHNLPRFVIVRERLLRQVVILKRMRKFESKITFATLMGADKASLASYRREKDISYIKIILDYWKDQAFIESYAFIKKGYAFDAIAIRFEATKVKKSRAV